MRESFRLAAMGWRWALALLLFATITAGGCANSAALAHREGDRLLMQRSYSAAVEKYTEAIRLEPDNWKHYDKRAAAHSQRISLREKASDRPGANFAASLADSNRAIALFPLAVGEPYLHMNRGIVLAAMGRYPESLEDMETAMRMEPSNPVRRAYRGCVLLLMGRDAEGNADIEFCLRTMPSIREEVEPVVNAIKARRGK
jgi:tetratricopeptide (TPR) repeat protein